MFFYLINEIIFFANVFVSTRIHLRYGVLSDILKTKFNKTINSYMKILFFLTRNGHNVPNMRTYKMNATTENSLDLL